MYKKPPNILAKNYHFNKERLKSKHFRKQNVALNVILLV
jgi:hypothetical protein